MLLWQDQKIQKAIQRKAHPQHSPGLQDIAHLVLQHQLEQLLIILWEVRHQGSHLLSCSHTQHYRIRLTPMKQAALALLSWAAYTLPQLMADAPLQDFVNGLR